MPSMDRSDVQKVLEKIQNIPTFSEIISRVMMKLYEPNTSMRELARDISVDSALVSKMFKLVNSAYYGFPRKITTLTQAMVILGFNSLKSILLTTTVLSLFKSNIQKLGLNYVKFWEHSLGCAVASKIVARNVGLKNEEEIFYAGLLHDIGKLVLHQFFYPQLEEILAFKESHGCSFLEAEHKVLQTDHAEIGRWLCEKWNFPLIFQEAVGHHHNPERALQSLQKQVFAVHLGNTVAKWEHLGDSGNQEDSVVHPLALELFGIEEMDLHLLSNEIQEEFKRSNIFLELLE